MCVRCDEQPESFKDLLGYQAIVVEASMEYQGDNWLGYDRRLRMG